MTRAGSQEKQPGLGPRPIRGRRFLLLDPRVPQDARRKRAGVGNQRQLTHRKQTVTLCNISWTSATSTRSVCSYQTFELWKTFNDAASLSYIEVTCAGKRIILCTNMVQFKQRSGTMFLRTRRRHGFGQTDSAWTACVKKKERPYVDA